VRAEALSRLGRDAEMRQELDRFLAEAPPRMATERARAEGMRRARSTALEIQ